MNKNISKEDLDRAIKKYPPKRWIKIAFKYFSAETEKKDMAARTTLLVILCLFFFTGLIGTALRASDEFIKWITFIYVSILIFLGGFLAAAAKMNNRRIRKIRAELGITNEEYNRLIDLYY